MFDKKQYGPLPVDEWDDSLTQIIDDMDGRPINVHRLMAHHPELLKAWWNFRNYAVTGGELGRRNGELVILRIALHMRAWYEWASHVQRALACGISLEEIERVKEGASAPGWEAGEILLLQAIDELVANRLISPQTLQDLGKYFSNGQVMDMMGIYGMYVTLGCMANTWNLELDEHVESQLPDTVTEENFRAAFPARR
jgi:hypothetical protein